MGNRRELLFSVTKKDFKITYFSGTGAGGQHRNRHMTCCRLFHKDSGVTVTGQSNKERLSNIKEAFSNLLNDPKFKLWYNLKVSETLNGITLKDRVDEMMDAKNIKTEGLVEGKWAVLDGSD